MTTTTPSTPATTQARARRGRARTRTVSSRPAVQLSALLPNEIDLHPEAKVASLVCPDCSTWCPITGTQGSTPKLVPHHTEKAGTPNARRCIGSNRRVILDITVAEWAARMFDGIAATAHRHGTTLIKRPTSPAPAVTQMPTRPEPMDAETARRTYTTHRATCRTCTDQTLCPVGRRLTAAVLRHQQPDPARRRAAEWAGVLPAVRRADTARVPADLELHTEKPDLPRRGTGRSTR